MKKPFKFRYVNEIVGAFVLLTVVVLVAAVIFVGHAQDWFVPKSVIYIRFPTKGTAGLTQGAEVEIMETLAGKLSRIVINDDGSMEGEISITGEFIRFVRSDSEAVIKKRFAVAGDSFIELTRGTGAELPAGRAYIPCRKDNDVTEMIQDIVKQVEEAVLPLIEQVERTLQAYEAVATNVVDPQGSIQQILLSIQGIVNEVDAGRGAVGMLLRDPATAADIQQIMESMNKLAAELVKVGEDVKDITATVSQTASDELPQLGRETNETIEEARRLIEGVQQHWLLRGSMGEQEEPSRISPAQLEPVAGKR